MRFSAAACCEPMHPSIQHGRSASSHRPALTLARCSVAAHCASLRVLATPALQASDVRSSLAHWAYYGLFPPQAAAFVRPPPVSAKILRIFGRGNCKEAIFALENGIFRRGVLRAHAPLNSAWSYHCARRLACGTPCFIGLTSRCFAHRARASCAPAVHAAGDDCTAKGLQPSRALP